MSADVIPGTTKVFGDGVRTVFASGTITFVFDEPRDLTNIQANLPSAGGAELLEFATGKPGGAAGAPFRDLDDGSTDLDPASDSGYAGVISVTIRRQNLQPISPDDLDDIVVEACLEGKTTEQSAMEREHTAFVFSTNHDFTKGMYLWNKFGRCPR